MRVDWMGIVSVKLQPFSQNAYCAPFSVVDISQNDLKIIKFFDEPVLSQNHKFSN